MSTVDDDIKNLETLVATLAADRAAELVGNPQGDPPFGTGSMWSGYHWTVKVK